MTDDKSIRNPDASLLVRWKSLDPIFEDSRVSKAGTYVFKVILDHVDRNTGRCFISIKTLAKKAKMDKRTVEKAVAILGKCGHLAIVVGGGRGRSNVYAPTLQTPAEPPGFSSQKHRPTRRGLSEETPAKNVRNPGQVGIKTPANWPDQPSYEPALEPGREDARARARGSLRDSKSPSRRRTVVDAALDIVARLEAEEETP